MFVALLFVVAASPQMPSWDDFVATTFDPGLCLPEPSAGELIVGGKAVLHLPTAMRSWAQRDFALDAAVQASADHEVWLLGDILTVLRPLRDKPQAFVAMLASLQRQLPGLDDRSALWLSELVRDTKLRDNDWDPDEDEMDDGLLFTPSWQLNTAVKGRHPFWQRRRGNSDVYQMAALVFADSKAICNTALDFEQYKQHVDNRYEEIGVVRNSLRRGTDASGREFAYYKLFYTWDLPFPFGSYDCFADVLIHFDEQNNLLTEMTAHGGDLYWASARTVFLPVVNREGEQVCALVVQEFGFDLDGVPDSKEDRLQAYRSQVGSNKVFAEQRFQQRKAPAPLPKQGTLPDLSILER